MSERYRLLVEAEPYLSAVKAWRESYEVARSAAFDFARSLGAEGFFESMEDYGIGALTPVDPPPPGWMVSKNRQGKGAMYPRRGKAGAEARAALEALPKVLPTDGIARLIGAPRSVSYKHKGGWGSGRCGVSFFHTVQICWAGETFIIVAPDTRSRIADLRASHPDVVIESGEWSPPPGLRPISEAECDLIFAKQRVEEERQEGAPYV